MHGPVGADVVVIGAGIAGAAAAHGLAPHARVIVLERESQPGYHTTGRSAAQYIATYGPPQVRALSLASRPFFDAPPAGFAEAPLLAPRGLLTVATEGQQAALDTAWAVLQASGAPGERLGADEAVRRVPVLRRERLIGAVHEPESFDIDVHALHQGFLRGLRRAGGNVVCDAEVCALRRQAAGWRVELRDGRVVEAPVVVNAAGAWCDAVGRLAGARPLGLRPLRRSALTFPAPPGLQVAHWPLVADAGHTWYFKPDAGQLLGSPANEDPSVPQDVQPEELDIAIAIDRLEAATTMPVRPTHTWAGLRTFAPDGDLVAGWDEAVPGFFWLAGQGGYGIQTAPAMGEAAAALVLGRAWPTALQQAGLGPAALSPQRLRGG